MGASKGISKKFETKRGPERKERKRKRTETFSKYIFKVLKQVHKDMGISKSSMNVMNSFIRDLFEQISLEASKLVRNNKVHTLTAKEIQSSVKLLLPGELALHAAIEGNKALNKIRWLRRNLWHHDSRSRRRSSKRKCHQARSGGGCLHQRREGQ